MTIDHRPSKVQVHIRRPAARVGTAGGILTSAVGRVERGARPLACAAVVCVALAAAGCNPASPKPVANPSATAPNAPLPSEDPKVADAQAEALDAYKGYLVVYASASQAANPDDPNLATYLADPLLSLTRHNIRTLKANGEVQLGAQTATVLRTQTEVAASPPTVTIHACLDYRGLKLVYATSRSQVPGSALKKTRVSAVVTVARYPTGQWLVNDAKQGSGTC